MKGILSILALIAFSFPASAEQDELAVGAQGGLLLPAFSPTSPTAFTLATWTAGVYGTYGVLDDLSLTASFSFFMFEGDAGGFKYTEESLDYEGTLICTTLAYHPEIGVRYKVYSGYDLAPYVDASIGFAWTTFHNSKLFNEDGLEYDVNINDFGEAIFTVSAGISLDYRIENTIFIGLGFKFTYAIGDDNLLEHFFTMPLQVSYYW